MPQPQRLDVLIARDYESNGETRTHWTRVGTAFAARKEEGWDIRLDALPLDGKLMLRVPREPGQQRQAAAAPRAPQRPAPRRWPPLAAGTGDDDFPPEDGGVPF